MNEHWEDAVRELKEALDKDPTNGLTKEEVDGILVRHNVYKRYYGATIMSAGLQKRVVKGKVYYYHKDLVTQRKRAVPESRSEPGTLGGNTLTFTNVNIHLVVGDVTIQGQVREIILKL